MPFPKPKIIQIFATASYDSKTGVTKETLYGLDQGGDTYIMVFDFTDGSYWKKLASSEDRL